MLRGGQSSERAERNQSNVPEDVSQEVSSYVAADDSASAPDEDSEVREVCGDQGVGRSAGVMFFQTRNVAAAGLLVQYVRTFGLDGAISEVGVSEDGNGWVLICALYGWRV